MERETGLERPIPNFDIVLPDHYAELLRRIVPPAEHRVGQEREEALPSSDLALTDFVHTPLQKAVDRAIASVQGRRQKVLSWGIKLVVTWSRESSFDLGSTDRRGLREAYRPYILGRYSQAHVQLWAGYRLLDAIDALRTEEPGLFPALPVLPPAASRPPRRPRGTDAYWDLDSEGNLAATARAVVADAPSRVQVKVRRYAIGKFLTWCRDTGRDPETVTFEEIDQDFLPSIAYLRNWTEVGVHTRKLVRALAAAGASARPSG